jgi:anthranilate synthase component 1
MCKIEMNKMTNKNSIPVRVNVKSFLADTVTPVSLYLRLRDKFPGAVLLESADNAEGKNSRSFIAIHPVAEILVENRKIKYSVPSCEINYESEIEKIKVADVLNDFLSLFKLEGNVPQEAMTGLIGYMTYDAIQYFENIKFKIQDSGFKIPELRYSLYKTIIAFDHLRHRMHIVEQLLPGDESDTSLVESVFRNMDVPQFQFEIYGEEKSNMSDEDFLSNVEKGKSHCRRGDVFQIVLSRQFKQKFSGDEFNVYRSLRAINPSPYLFFADFGDYRIFGSSPEAQLIVTNNSSSGIPLSLAPCPPSLTAIVHPIAGTFRRSGDETQDRKLEDELLNDPKENSEHIMLVDLARNDLSRSATDVKVEAFREVHRFSHVIHLVSKVSGKVEAGTNVFSLVGNTFPAGTLSGAPKIKAMQLIDQYEPTARGYYGGCIGLIGFDGTMNQAIMIRSFLSKEGELTYQAGAGVVVSSESKKELQEIKNKLEALRSAINAAQKIAN